MYLNRKLATEYLRQRGFKCGDSRLAHLAVTGNGPEFQYEGKYPIYTEEALDAWIESRLSAPVRSASKTAPALLKEQSSDSEQGQAATPITPKRPGRPRQKEPAELKTDAA